MSLNFEELDHAETPYGELILRKRRALSLGGVEIYEVKLDGEFLMSSLVKDSEVALAERGLAALGDSEASAAGLDVVVGGLGLGYTAAAALDHPAVSSMLVVEALAEVIDWHERKLVPMGPQLVADARCRLRRGDFFERARDVDQGFDDEQPGRRFDAVLLDIDHSPTGLLHNSHADFYLPDGLRRLKIHLKPGGVFALWSAEPPEATFTKTLREAFDSVDAHAVEFMNPLLDCVDVNSIYVCH
ncbi:MAG: spermidine synthase [Planctomycetota bacterium]|jgi:spermidine synthase|nr:spermidine synthase [Planctomycetota bacterium]